MAETQPTLNSDPVSSTEGLEEVQVNAGSVPGQTDAKEQVDLKALEVINQTTGRNFTSFAEAQKHLQHLNSLVGDRTVAEQREKAAMADLFLTAYAEEQNLSLDEAREQIKSLVGNKRTPKPMEQEPVSSVPQEVQAQLEELARFKFVSEHPDAKPYIEKVSAYAKATKTTLSSAYTELYGDVLGKAKEDENAESLRAEKIAAQVNVSASGNVAPPPDSERQLKQRYAKSGGRDTDAMRDIIKERMLKSASKK